MISSIVAHTKSKANKSRFIQLPERGWFPMKSLGDYPTVTAIPLDPEKVKEAQLLYQQQKQLEQAQAGNLTKKQLQKQRAANFKSTYANKQQNGQSNNNVGYKVQGGKKQQNRNQRIKDQGIGNEVILIDGEEEMIIDTPMNAMGGGNEPKLSSTKLFHKDIYFPPKIGTSNKFQILDASADDEIEDNQPQKQINVNEHLPFLQSLFPDIEEVTLLILLDEANGDVGSIVDSFLLASNIQEGDDISVDMSGFGSSAFANVNNGSGGTTNAKTSSFSSDFLIKSPTSSYITPGGPSTSSSSGGVFKQPMTDAVDDEDFEELLKELARQDEENARLIQIANESEFEEQQRLEEQKRKQKQGEEAELERQKIEKQQKYEADRKKQKNASNETSNNNTKMVQDFNSIISHLTDLFPKYSKRDLTSYLDKHSYDVNATIDTLLQFESMGSSPSSSNISKKDGLIKPTKPTKSTTTATTTTISTLPQLDLKELKNPPVMTTHPLFQTSPTTTTTTTKKPINNFPINNSPSYKNNQSNSLPGPARVIPLSEIIENEEIEKIVSKIDSVHNNNNKFNNTTNSNSFNTTPPVTVSPKVIPLSDIMQDEEDISNIESVYRYIGRPGSSLSNRVQDSLSSPKPSLLSNKPSEMIKPVPTDFDKKIAQLKIQFPLIDEEILESIFTESQFSFKDTMACIYEVFPNESKLNTRSVSNFASKVRESSNQFYAKNNIFNHDSSSNGIVLNANAGGRSNTNNSSGINNRINILPAPKNKVEIYSGVLEETEFRKVEPQQRVKKEPYVDPYFAEVLGGNGGIDATRRNERSYKEYRADAEKYSRLKQAMFRSASEAYMKNKQADARQYSEQGRRYEQLGNEANACASNQIFLACNSRSGDTLRIDLHGLHVGEALDMVQYALDIHSKGEYEGDKPRYISFITGVGNHSIGGVARIKPAVIAFLKGCGVKHSDQGGSIVIHV